MRWTPVAYLRPDSYAIAAAILASPKPAASLDVDFEYYDFAQRRGAYPARRASTAPTLGPGQQSLQKIWAATWGGYTPMIFFQDRRGRVFQAQTDQTDVIDQVVRRAARSR